MLYCKGHILVIYLIGMNINYPKNFKELIVKEFYRIYKRLEEIKDDIDLKDFISTELVSIVLNIDFDEAYKLPSYIYDNIKFIITDTLPNLYDKDGNFDKNMIPKKINIEGKEIKIPNDLSKEWLTLGQLDHMRQIALRIEKKYRTIEIYDILSKLNKNITINDLTIDEKELLLSYNVKIYNDLMYELHNIVAIGIYKNYTDDEFSSKNYKKLATKLLSYNIHDIYIIGFFFLMSLKLSLISKITFLMVNRLLTYCHL